jgi:hypothetical protein
MPRTQTEERNKFNGTDKGDDDENEDDAKIVGKVCGHGAEESMWT